VAEAKQLRDMRNGKVQDDDDQDDDDDADDADDAGQGEDALAKLDAKIAELEARLLKLYVKRDELAGEADDDDADDEDADDDDDEDEDEVVFIHTPRKGLPEHDASEPQTGCPECIAAGLVPAVQAAPRRATRSRSRSRNGRTRVAA
jgi:hypothetical protein